MEDGSTLERLLADMTVQRDSVRFPAVGLAVGLAVGPVVGPAVGPVPGPVPGPSGAHSRPGCRFSLARCVHRLGLNQAAAFPQFLSLQGFLTESLPLSPLSCA